MNIAAGKRENGEALVAIYLRVTVTVH